MNCYGSPIQQLPALDRAVRGTVKATRGFYKAGLSVQEITQRLTTIVGDSALDERTVSLAVARLVKRGMLSRGSRGWRAA